MGSLRRKVSTMNVHMQPDIGASASDRCQRIQDCPSDSDEYRPLRGDDFPTLEVDSASCGMSFTVGPPELEGLASLVVRLGTKTMLSGSGLQGMISPSAASTELTKGLDRVLGTHRNFVVTWDFRGLTPSCSVLKGLFRYCALNRARLTSQVKSAAVIVTDNLFVAGTVGIIGNFIEACMPGCPFVVCHGEAAAEEFFHTSTLLKFNSVSPFVTMVDVKDVCRHPSSDKACVGSLAPASTTTANQASKSHAAVATTFHTLPNGDLRVIQSPPADIVLSRVMENPQEGDGQEDGPVRIQTSGHSGGDLPAVSAVLFQGPKESLQPFVGAYFHIGELVIDAEMESISRHHASSPGHSVGCTCLAGLQTILYKLIKRILDA